MEGCVTVRVTDYVGQGKPFLKATLVKDGDVIEIRSEGNRRTAEETPFGQAVFELDVGLPNGDEATWTVNKTTLERFAKAWGEESKEWIGRKARLEIKNMNVRGTQRDVLYGHPLAVLEGATPDPLQQQLKEAVDELRGVYPKMPLAHFDIMLNKVRNLNVDAKEAAGRLGLKVEGDTVFLK